MTRFERLLTPSPVTCCECDHPLSVQELDEFHNAVEESLHGDVYCRTCMEASLALCSECSRHYTSGSICEECAAKEYGMVG